MTNLRVTRNFGGVRLDRCEFRWMQPDRVPIIRPQSIGHHARVALIPPAAAVDVLAPQPNRWLEDKLTRENDQPPHLANGKWFLFGSARCLGGRHYRLVPKRGQNQTDFWLAQEESYRMVEDFIRIAECLDDQEPKQGVKAAIGQAHSFAARYGPLGYGAVVTFKSGETPLPIESPNWGYAEPAAYWLSEALTMRAVVRLRNVTTGSRAPRRIQEALLGTLRDGFFLDPRRETMWDPSATKFHEVTEGLLVDTQKKSKSEQILMDHFRAYIRELGIPVIGCDDDPLQSAQYRLFQRQRYIPPKPRSVLPDQDEQHQQDLTQALDQAEQELVSFLDEKLSANVGVHCFNTTSDAFGVLPHNLLGALYLLLAKNMANKKPEPVCAKCGKALINRKRIGNLNFCDNKCCQQYRRANQRRK